MNNSCITGKRIYEDQQLAEEALIQYHIRNEFSGNQGPINVYRCDNCGNWHFTSKGEKSALLSNSEIVNRIKSERRVFQWEQKLK